MKAVIYRDLMCLKSQIKNFFWCFILIFMPPMLIKYREVAVLNYDIVFIVMSALTPAVIGMQFLSSILIEDKQNDIMPIIFRNDISVLKYFTSKTIVPFIVSIMYMVLSLVIYQLFFPVIMFSKYNILEIVELYGIYLILTFVVLILEELIVFIVKNDAYLPTVSIFSALALIFGVFYFINPLQNLLIFIFVMSFVSIFILFIISYILKNKYANIKII